MRNWRWRCGSPVLIRVCHGVVGLKPLSFFFFESSQHIWISIHFQSWILPENVSLYSEFRWKDMCIKFYFDTCNLIFTQNLSEHVPMLAKAKKSVSWNVDEQNPRFARGKSPLKDCEELCNEFESTKVVWGPVVWDLEVPLRNAITFIRGMSSKPPGPKAPIYR